MHGTVELVTSIWQIIYTWIWLAADIIKRIYGRYVEMTFNDNPDVFV